MSNRPSEMKFETKPAPDGNGYLVTGTTTPDGRVVTARAPFKDYIPDTLCRVAYDLLNG